MMARMRTTRNAPDHLAAIGEELGELAADAFADVRDRVEVGGGAVADGARKLAEVAAEALTDVRHELATRIEPEQQPSRKWRWFLAGGIAAAVAVALWAVLSRRPQQVDEPVRAVPEPSGGEGASQPAATPTTSAAARNGHSTG